MLRSFIFYVLFLVTSHVLAVPTTNSRLKGRSFQVDRIQRTNYVPHGPAALRKAYRKFGISPNTSAVTTQQNKITATNSGFKPLDFSPKRPRPLLAATGSNSTLAAAGKNGSVATTSVNGDVEFVSPVSIGGQTLMLDFDTGSSDLWVFSSELAAPDQRNHMIFDSKKSKTFQAMQDHTFSISYGDGSSASGSVGTDVVSIGGATVQKQAVELAQKVSGSFLQETASNGLVGLAFSKLNTVKPAQQKTFFDNIAGQLEEPVMTVLLKSDSNKGSYEFGRIDSAKYTGQMMNVSVDPANGFWQFNSASFKVGNDGQTQQITQAPTAIADTGTSLMLVSPEVATAFYDQIQDAQNDPNVGGFIFPCDAQLPSLSIAVGDNAMATIPPNVLNFATVGTDRTTGREYCYGGVQSSETSQFMIFGDVFLKSMFVVFDQRGPSLGLASPA